ncbi:hypothetical protein JTE90_017387 [Oedothorax gibbosus]|uniref:Uncharacterized protein n=1 Tax=Oedothorax gibbosus TaxID=931172 RepID=A0AAV6VNU8_9ARAC|nr:hypothetical protein JTE90_017387 [Oedothorax gibbosus]
MDSSMVYPDFAMHKQQKIFVRQYHLPKSYYKTGKNKFRNYCIRLCKESLITGFPALASTRIGPCRRALKALVLVVCVCGFLYQTSEFLRMYLEYPTMVDMLVENPDSVPLPAIGFCNRNRMRRTVMCTIEQNVCEWNQSDFCSLYPKYCMKYKPPVKAMPDPRMYVQSNRTFAYINLVGQRKGDLVTMCSILTETGKPCTNLVSEPAVNREGYPNTCFTVESLWGQPDAQPRSIPVTGQVSVQLKLHPEEYVDYFEMIQAHVLVHDPRALANPIREGISLEPGKMYNIYVSQTVTERLPAPYRTNCTDYLKLWRENGGHGPLTGRSCSEKCKMERMLQSVGCVSQSVSYPNNNNTICENNKIFPSLEIVEGCSRECADACIETTYHVRVEVQAELSVKCLPEDMNCKYKDMYLNFLFNRFEVTKFLHEPKFESVGVFSYIGGYMGMWLGISLVALFDLAETLANLLVIYPLSRSSKMKTRVV